MSRGTLIIIESVLGGWLVETVAPPVYGDAPKVAARLRKEGAAARAKGGVVLVNADAGVS